MLVITVAPAVGPVAAGGWVVVVVVCGGGGGSVVVVVCVGGSVVVVVCGGGSSVVVPGTGHDRVPAALSPTRLRALTATSSCPPAQNVLPPQGMVSWALVPVVWAPRVPPAKSPLASTV